MDVPGNDDVEVAPSDLGPVDLDLAVLSDEELTALALAADPEAPIDDDAVPFGQRQGGALLPDWYMPAPATLTRSPAKRATVGLIVVSLLALNAVGLCVTYGVIEGAW